MSAFRQEHKTHRRPLLLLSGLGLLLFVVLGYLILFFDGPPPDDAHLMPRWSERGGNANPLAVLCKTLVASSIKDWENIPSDLRAPEQAPTPEVRAFIGSHRAEIEAFHSLMRTDPSRWQWPDGANMAKYEYILLNQGASECQTLSLVLRSKAWQLCEEKRVEEAAELCLQMTRWAEGLYAAGGFVIHQLVAQGIQTGALRTLLRVVQNDDITPELLREILQQLCQLKGIQATHVQHAMRVEYAWFKDCSEKLSKQEMTGISRLPEHVKFLSPMFFKRNQTLALRVQLDTPVITALDSGWKSALSAWEARTANLDALQQSNAWLFFINPNCVGQSPILHDITLPRLRHDSNHRDSLILLLALRLHELDHGNLPSTLNVLVPTYLPRVPLDAISETPFLWNAKLQVLYTWGENGKDDGGIIDEQRAERGLDWGVRYPWRPALNKSSASCPEP